MGELVKKLYLCGSFRFQREMESLEKKLAKGKIEYGASKGKSSRGIIRCLRKIDSSDIIYVVNPEGYVGKSVSVDIGYAYAKNKGIYAMFPIKDPPVADLISAVATPDELIRLLSGNLPAMKR